MSLPVKLLGGPFASVFDVGAFRGDFARGCRRAWPRADVYSFEPLETMPADVRAPWRWFGVALAAERGARTINRCEFVPSSSFLAMTDVHKTAFPYTRDHVEQVVHVETLDRFAHLVNGPALLKIDVQGYELEVLRGGAAALERFSAVVLETSWAALYEGAPTFDQLDRLLSRSGFMHETRVDELRDPTDDNVLLQSDELWTR